MINANFKNANLYQANFRGADLTNADFRNSTLANTNLLGCKLDGAKFGGSDWEDAIYDDDAMSLGDFEHYADDVEEEVPVDEDDDDAAAAAVDIPIPALLQKQMKAPEEYDKEHPLKEAVWEPETERRFRTPPCFRRPGRGTREGKVGRLPKGGGGASNGGSAWKRLWGLLGRPGGAWYCAVHGAFSGLLRVAL